ncbi:MAG TPA: Tn3 family transposase [Mycobacterium sp.]|nr:Tn3 family transposase [Mycobacterium sp.]
MPSRSHSITNANERNLPKATFTPLLGRHPDEHELSVQCLRIVQASLVYVNTLMIQDLLDDPDCAGLLTTPADKRGVTPLFWEHVLPYGEVKLDMTSRLTLSG